jgi:hypothetical protein
MADQFEKYMQSNREAFDLYEPDDYLWKGIEKNIQKEEKKNVNWRFVATRVAAVVAIFIASWYFHDWYGNRDRQSMITETAKELNIPELKEIENYYESVIDDKLQEIEPMLTKYPGLDEEINRDLVALDSLYISLKKDLHDNVANREVIEAMIQNYRLRVEILEDLLSMLAPDDEQKNSLSNEI